MSLGLDGCEVCLCDPCARVRPCVPCVSRVCPGSCLFTGRILGTMRVVLNTSSVWRKASMSASSESDDELFGTPISDEDEVESARSRRARAQRAADPQKQQRFRQQQEVLDEQGRRRFHGAFTGGFSAGYFNTVGSEAGWAPTEWRSTRGARGAQQASTRPEDFMDDEDLAERGGAGVLVTRAGFAKSKRTDDVSDSALAPSLQAKCPSAVAAGTEMRPDISSVLTIPKGASSIGFRMLRQMGWRDGFGIGPRTYRSASKRKRTGTDGAMAPQRKLYGPTMPPQMHASSVSAYPECSDGEHEDLREDSHTLNAARLRGFAPRLVPTRITAYTYKNDLHGVGYEPHRAAPEFAESCKRRAESRAPRPIGAYEDVEDAYAQADISQYDLALENEADLDEDAKLPGRVETVWRGNGAGVAMTESLPVAGFVRAHRTLPPQPWHEAPEVPASFRERHIFPTPPVAPPLPQAALDALLAHEAVQQQSANSAALSEGVGSSRIGAVDALSPGSDVWSLVSKEQLIHLWQRLQTIRAQQVSQQQVSQRPLQAPPLPRASLQHHQLQMSALPMKPPPPPPPPPPPMPMPMPLPPPPLLPPLPDRPADGYALPENCQPYLSDAPKQRRFESFLRDENSARALAAAAGFDARSVHGELLEFSKVASFFSQRAHSVISSRFTSSEVQSAQLPGGVIVGGLSRVLRPQQGPSATPPALSAAAAAAAPTSCGVETSADTKQSVDVVQMKSRILVGKSSRTALPWQPDALLCKRFGVPAPANALHTRGGSRPSATIGTATFDDALLPAFSGPPQPPHGLSPNIPHGVPPHMFPHVPAAEAQAAEFLASITPAMSSRGTVPPPPPQRPPMAPQPPPPPAPSSDTLSAEASMPKGEAKERPPLALFKAVFAGSSDEDDAACEQHGSTQAPQSQHSRVASNETAAMTALDAPHAATLAPSAQSMAGTHAKTASLMPTAMLSTTTSAFMTGAAASVALSDGESESVSSKEEVVEENSGRKKRQHHKHRHKHKKEDKHHRKKHRKGDKSERTTKKKHSTPVF